MLTRGLFKQFLTNLDSYPALRSFIYTHLYLEYLSLMYKSIPTHDRFTDALVMIESSYCSYLLSNDEALVHKHAKAINPHIITITMTDLVSNISNQI